MPVRIGAIEAAGLRRQPVRRYHREAQGATVSSAFLCHSHKDAALLQGVVTLLRESGWDVYVDWADPEMPEKPDRETAERIQAKIKQSRYFLFLATANSTTSRWCPWEIGFADGAKGPNGMLVMPTEDRSGAWHGNEYLQLYRRIDMSDAGRLQVFQPWQRGIGTDLSVL